MKWECIPASAITKSATRHRARTIQRANYVTKFIAVDGEGSGRNDQHQYVLLGVGDTYISRDTQIQWWEAFDLLYEIYSSHNGTAFVGFFLGYDFTQILRTLPQSRAEMLFMPSGIAKRQRRSGEHLRPFPVSCTSPTGTEWEFDILGSKRLSLRPRSCKCPRGRGIPLCACKPHPWLYVCDSGPFFQASFLSVIDPAKWETPIVTPEEFEILSVGKSRRDTAVLDSDMIKYNQLENDVLVRVMGELDKGLRALGVHLRASQWFGPGQAAQGWLKTLQLPKTEALRPIVPDWYMKAARDSYYGGWFEILMHGHVKGETHEYDINSAYPNIIATLPCLEHGEWKRGKELAKIPKDSYALVHCRVRGSDPYMGPLPFRRKDGSICKPLYTEGVYWLDEINAAREAGLVDTIECLEWFAYLPCECSPPLTKIRELYDIRKSVGKDTPMGKACKLVYNSVYGKFAQSVGGEFVQYGNAMYASLITSGCRSQILRAIATHPGKASAVTMVATDGVYFTSPHPKLVISGELGEWDHAIKSNITQFKPGVYWDDKSRAAIAAGKSPQFKSRGISAMDFAKRISDIDAQFRDWNAIHRGEWPEITFNVGFSMVTCKQALRRNDWSQAGRVSENSVSHTSEPYSKRYAPYLDSDNNIRTKPFEYADYDSPANRSVPYAETFGWTYDPEENGITPDGTVDEVSQWVIVF